MIQLPFSIPLSIAIFTIIWWVVLFLMLPLGVSSQHEGLNMIEGTDPGAPQAPKLLLKLSLTTIVAALLFVLLIVIVNNGGVI